MIMPAVSIIPDETSREEPRRVIAGMENPEMSWQRVETVAVIGIQPSCSLQE